MSKAALNPEQALEQAMALAGRGAFRRAIALTGSVYRASGGVHERALSLLIQLLADIDPGRYVPDLEEDIRLCLAAEAHEVQDLSWLVASQLLHKYGLASSDDASMTANADAMAGLRRDTLLAEWLSRCINVHPGMERVLVALRERLLASLCEGDTGAVDLAAAMAIQLFRNGYLWPVSEREEPVLSRLSRSGERWARSPVDDKALTDAVALALYQPWLEREPAMDAFGASENPRVRRLFEVTVRQPRTEAELAVSFSSSDAAGGDARVRARYEISPYPCWSGRPPEGSAPDLRRMFSGNPPRRILSAGCGTGYEPLALALANPASSVTAVDLSRRSLAYARRATRELGVETIRFEPGDLCALPASGQTFEAVFCTGVIHHLEDPQAGLRALAQVTAPGGWLCVSVYSRRARMAVTDVRARIRRAGLTDSVAGVRAARAAVLAGRYGDSSSAIASSADFYSLSGCRDLLFHPLEHCFSVPEVATLVRGAGLRFRGMIPPNPAVHQAFVQRFGRQALTDLACWDRYEQSHPEAFGGMYRFWLSR